MGVSRAQQLFTIKCSVQSMMLGAVAGFDGAVCVWDVRSGASTAPHLMQRWEAHPGSEILTMLHDPLKNVLVTAGNDSTIKVGVYLHASASH